MQEYNFVILQVASYDYINILETTSNRLHELIANKVPTYLVINDNKYKDERFTDIFNLERKTSFTQKIKYALDKIKNSYIILILDDWYILSINIEKINNLLSKNEIYNNYYIFKFQKNLEETHKSKLVIKNCSVQSGLWNRQYLRLLCLDDMSPWEFEHQSVFITKEYTFMINFNNIYAAEIIDLINRGKIRNEAINLLSKFDISNLQKFPSSILKYNILKYTKIILWRVIKYFPLVYKYYIISNFKRKKNEPTIKKLLKK
jgi:hypothetical protein